MRIHITESSYQRLFEEDEDSKYMTFKKFYKEIKDFIKGLLSKPVETKPSEELKSLGLSNGELRNRLQDMSVLKRTSDIREPDDEENVGSKRSRYYIKYDMYTDKFKDKMRQLHKELVDECKMRDRNKSMIRLTEGDLRRIVNNCVNQILMETEGTVGYAAGATSTQNANNAQYAMPALGGKTNNKKVGGNPYSQPIKQASPSEARKGDVTKSPNTVDMGPALERKGKNGSIAMNHV